MDDARIAMTRALLENTAWTERTRGFARSIRTAGHGAGGLLVVGTPAEEPWHMTAHLDQESRIGGIPDLMPTLVRHRVPAGAPPHLAVGLARLEVARKGETLVVVAPGDTGEQVLERLADARRSGAVILALEGGDRELRGLAHESLTVADGASGLWPRSALRPDGLIVPQPVAFDTAQHLITLAAGEEPTVVGQRRGFRDRLSRWIDFMAGSVQTADALD